MYLDDELELIWRRTNGMLLSKRAGLLVDACIKRFGNPCKIGIRAWVNNVKRIESEWQSFAKKHPELKPDGFRKIVTESFNETMATRLAINACELFGWEQNSKEHK